MRHGARKFFVLMLKPAGAGRRISTASSSRLFGALSSVLISATLLFSPQLALAQLSQQGPKLVGSNVVGHRRTRLLRGGVCRRQYRHCGRVPRQLERWSGVGLHAHRWCVEPTRRQAGRKRRDWKRGARCLRRTVCRRQHRHRGRAGGQLGGWSGVDLCPQRRHVDPARRQAGRHRRGWNRQTRRCRTVCRRQYRHRGRSQRSPRGGVDLYPQRRHVDPARRQAGRHRRCWTCPTGRRGRAVGRWQHRPRGRACRQLERWSDVGLHAQRHCLEPTRR